jgi:hypothetical protein
MIVLHTAIAPMNTTPTISNWTHSGMEEVLALQNALANQRVREAKELSGQPRCYVQTDHPWDEVLNRHNRLICGQRGSHNVDMVVTGTKRRS